MSTTQEPDFAGIAKRLANAKYGPPEALPVTLVIGGKCYTEEEHEAEFQRRAKAMLKDILAILSPDRVEIVEQTICPDHGIKLP